MSGGGTIRRIESIEELVGLVSLTDLRAFEFSGKATEDPTTDDADPEVSIEYGESHTDQQLVDRFRFTVKTADAEYFIDVAPVYTISEAVEVPLPIRLSFAERVGFMTAFPFVREGLVSSAARLGRRPPLLDLMRPGDFSINAEAEQPHLGSVAPD